MQSLIEYFHRVAGYSPWAVIIELLLIGLVVYWVVDFLEGTRGERLFRGVILVVIAAVLLLNLVAERLHLERLQQLYNYFLIFVLVVAVAAFQPEIRRALISIAQPGFLHGSSQTLSRTIEEIVAAVSSLAQTRTGAVIVIQKQVALGEFIETGVKIDAKVTKELLKTIFYEGTALHDMAVIINGDRIIAASVQLPLAEADRIDGVDLGSRHRAAIGMSTGSDASIIVVSEETGIISLALNGKLIRNIDDTRLRKHLTNVMVRQQAPGWFRRVRSKPAVIDAAADSDKKTAHERKTDEEDND
ncbi:MAG: diadenylate cyclase CdaA [Sedimentisphaerales bacterium]|nr:diadenylate cyclase CdaA [Sedimentisphaerales bacterium]